MEQDLMTVVHGGVTAPQGFKAAGVRAEIRKKNRRDLALVYSEFPAAAAGVFTRNKVKAAPLLLTMANLESGTAQAVVVNSGYANACNGEQGMKDALRMASLTGERLGINPKLVIVGSTGVIGLPLPMDKIEAGIAAAAESLHEDGGSAAAEAIMTTDTVLKEVAVRVPVGGKPVTIAGMAKGSGMIHPNMATMLGFITTDAALLPSLLKESLSQAINKSFNMVTVDGDTSTNDMVVILANGAAGAGTLTPGHADLPVFQAALDFVCVELAKMIARDGEGATKLIEVQVKGASSPVDARKAALAIAGSNLVKAAVYGEDANWGRVITALGYSEAEFAPDQVDIFLGRLQVAANGAALPFDEARAREILGEKEVAITVDLKGGTASATAWGCDLTYDYVRINASYRT